jgi:hypothetical protein
MFLIFVAIFLVVNKKTLVIVAHDTYEGYMSTNPGFSSARNLSDEGGNDKYQTIFEKLKIMLTKAPASITYQLKNKDIKLQEIQFLVEFPEYKIILNDREKAIKNNFLKNSSMVNAEVTSKGLDLNAKVRLKGDLGDHWLGRDRMSLRVNLKNKDTLFGFNKFSIHKPRARQHPYEQAFQASLKEIGNITSNHQYAKIKFNEDDWGIMNVEEHMSKEFLEKQGLKDSMIFRFSDDKKWLQYNNIPENYSHYRYSDPKLIATVTQQDKYLDEILNRKRYTYVLEQRLKKNHALLYSREPHVRAFFNSLLWNNQHTLSDGNSRYYFNPYTLNLEPITTDQGMFMALKDNLDENLNKIHLTETYKQVLTSFSNYGNKARFLDDSIKSFSNIEDKLNQYNKYFPLDAYKKDSILIENIKFIEENDSKLFNWLANYDLNNQKGINIETLPSFKQSNDFPEHLHVRHYDDGRILIFNLLPDDVFISKIEYDGLKSGFGGFKIPGFKSSSYDPYILETNIKGIQDNKITIYSSYQDKRRAIKAFPTLLSSEIFNPLVTTNKPDFPFLESNKKGLWEIIPGQWEVREPIIIDGSLKIRENTRLKFSNDSYLVVRGKVDFIGSKTNPIIFENLDLGWKGIYVLSKEEDNSILHNVVIRNTTGVSDGLLSLTGGVNLYKGNIKLKKLDIQGSKAEDSLNIVQAHVDIEDLNISNSYSDSFDCDYCTGIIKSSTFDNIGGDALDFSGSMLLITDVIVSNVKDKGFSIGEASDIKINDSSISNIGVGIATKDGSNASGSNIDIQGYSMYAAMTYSKKKHYPNFSSLNLFNCNVSGKNPFLRQKGTHLNANNLEIIERVLDVDELYASGVMKK